MGNVISAIIGALATAFVLAPSSYRSSAHGESGWRKKLLDLVSAQDVGEREILILQSLVNPSRNPNSFVKSKNIDGLINCFCTQANQYLKHHAFLPKQKQDNHIDSETFRYLGRVLLKADWIKQTGSFLDKETKRIALYKEAKGKLVNYVSKSSMCPCYKSVIKCLYFIISIILSILITYWAYVNKQKSLTIFKEFNSILWILVLFTFTVMILLNIKKSWHCPFLHHILVTLSTIVTLAINLIPLLLNSVIYISHKNYPSLFLICSAFAIYIFSILTTHLLFREDA